MGFSIIILTILIRLILWPLNNKAIRTQKVLSELKPKIEETQKKFKNNKEAQAKALMALYKEHKINPLAGFLPILIQIPIIIALWRVFLNSIKLDSSSLYYFVKAPDFIQPIFLGAIDLTKGNVLLAMIAGLLQYIQTKMILPAPTSAAAGKSAGAPDFGRIMSKQMLYFGPILSIIIFWSLPAALPLYWIVVTLLTIIQQYFNQYGNGESRKN
jgi:YidC/Oxa1 family membrane protein insertase